MAVLFGFLAFILAVLLGLAVVYCIHSHQEMGRVRQQAQTDLARYQGIADLEKYKTELDRQLRSTRALLPKFQTLDELEHYRVRLSKEVEELKRASVDWRERITSQESTLSSLLTQSESVEEALEMQSFGVYRPKYGFEDSERYSNQLSAVREQQKAIIKSGGATHCPQEWTVDGSVTKGRKMVKEHSKLMLRAFNGECDAAIAKVKYNNVSNMETRINRSFDAINKLGESKQLWITREYLSLKLQELYLVHEHREQVQAEREEQRFIKQQMREEEKAQRELERAQKEAEQEEQAKSKALEQARQELLQSHGNQTDRLKAIVDRLETELKDALERKAKAIARAQLTRSGHVYVLSNIGSFGEGVYKIGMTRRLEPLERVKELGDASVPFGYDVHAMIYSEDAPSLEQTLHQHFNSHRVNMANPRREFFRVTLDEIRAAVRKNFGEITFVKVPKAEEYRKSRAIQEDLDEARDCGAVPSS